MDSTEVKPKQIILCGGGLDTMATLAWLNNSWRSVYECNSPKTINTILLVIDYGQQAFIQEYDAVVAARNALFPERHDDGKPLVQVVSYKDHLNLIHSINRGEGLLFGNGTESKLIGRNLTLAYLAFMYGGYTNSLMFCLTKETDIEMPVDTTKFFLSNLGRVMKQSDMFGCVRAPIIDVPKLQALQFAVKWWPQLFDHAFSCWTPVDEVPCGECRHCKRFEYFRGLCNENRFF